jgi:hypothetical protein
MRWQVQSTLKTWQLTAVWCCVVPSLTMIFIRGQQTHIDKNVSSRLRYHAIPVAISVLYHGRPHDYTAYRSIAMSFQSNDPIDDKLAWAVTHEPPAGDATYYWAADDRGMADYVIGSFAIFGPHVTSLYRFYFVILAIAVSLFLLDLGRYAVMSATAAFALSAIYTCMSVISLGNLTVDVFEPGALYEPRVVELLGFIPTLHLGLVGLIDEGWTLRRITLLSAQAAILAACYHARSSVGWEVAFIVTINGLILIRHVWSAGRSAVFDSRRLAAAAWPSAAVIVALMLVAAYQRHAYNARYFEDLGSRTIWHNVLMGVASNAALSATYNLHIDDRMIVEDVTNYLRQQHDSRLTADWTTSNIINSLGGHTVFNWYVYEDAARDMYWHLWRIEPLSMLRCYMIDKPTEQLRVMTKAAIGSSALPGGARLSFNPFAPIALMMAFPGMLLAWRSGVSFVPTLAAAVVLLVFSAAPGLFFYPVVHTMMGMFATVALIVYVGLATTVVRLRTRSR